MNYSQSSGSQPGAAPASGGSWPNSRVSEHNNAAESPSRRRYDGQFLMVTDGPGDSPMPARQDSPLTAAAESWVEIASEPSSSSLSSIADDEIVTTGLRVRGVSHPSRRRHQAQRQQLQHQRSMPQSYMVSYAAARGGGTSSQEDFDETESEEEASPMSRPTNGPRLATSPLHLDSARQLTALQPSHESGYDDGDDDDSGDESATALGPPPTAPVFRPQPNAFSHPPSHLTHRHSTPAYMGGNDAHLHQRASGVRSRRSSYSRGGSNRNGPHFMSPSYREDNDADLRASLTTLLSCAAAARGLPSRRREEPDAIGAGPASNAAAMQPMGLRLVPETELMAEGPSRPAHQPPANAAPEPKASVAATAPPGATTGVDRADAAAGLSRSPASNASAGRGEKSKRAATGTPSSGGGQKSARATKKKRTEASASSADTLISPTLLTWVVSAGVVVLVSVVGFGAGYVIGREVGRQEGAGPLISGGGGIGGGGVPHGSAAANATGSCSREIISQSSTGGTLRRFRWGSMGRSVAA